MYWATLVLLIACGWSSTAEAQSHPETLDVTLIDYGKRPPLTLMAARDKAAQVLSAAGVRTSWRFCEGASERPGGRACTGEGPLAVVVRLVPGRQAKNWKFSGSTCGYALVGGPDQFGRLALVDLDCVDRMAGSVERRRPAALGHVIAHELGHLLLGGGSHAESGLMSARWSKPEMNALYRGDLSFSDEEAIRLRQAVQVRSASGHLASK